MTKTLRRLNDRLMLGEKGRLKSLFTRVRFQNQRRGSVVGKINYEMDGLVKEDFSHLGTGNFQLHLLQ